MQAQNRNIVHMDLDSFFVSVEKLIDSNLEGKPVIIGGTNDRGVVSSCSYEARAFGVHSAMPMNLALRLCPHAIIRKGDHDAYAKKSTEVTQIIDEQAPLYEKSSIDEFYMDISGMDKFFGCYKWTNELKRKIIHETGLPISFGLAQNKTVSKMATNESKPDGQLQIPYQNTQAFLNPLSIQKIPMVGDQTAKKLRYMGLYKIQQLVSIPQDMLFHTLGKNGVSIWKKAQGIDNSPVIPHHDRKSISAERTFMKDTIDIRYLKNLITSMAENLAYDLRKEQKLSSCISVKIRYSNFDTHSTQIKIPFTNNEKIIMEKAHHLFDKLYNKRMRIRLVGLRLSDLIQGAYQIDLFNDNEKDLELLKALDKIKNKFGKTAIKRAATMNTKFGNSEFNPFQGKM